MCAWLVRFAAAYLRTYGYQLLSRNKFFRNGATLIKGATHVLNAKRAFALCITHCWRAALLAILLSAQPPRTWVCMQELLVFKR